MAEIIGQRWEVYGYEDKKDHILKEGEIICINNIPNYNENEVVALVGNGIVTVENLLECHLSNSKRFTILHSESPLNDVSTVGNYLGNYTQSITEMNFPENFEEGLYYLFVLPLEYDNYFSQILFSLSGDCYVRQSRYKDGWTEWITAGGSGFDEQLLQTLTQDIENISREILGYGGINHRLENLEDHFTDNVLDVIKGGTGSTSLSGGNNNLIEKLFTSNRPSPEYLASFSLYSGRLDGSITSIADLKAALDIPAAQEIPLPVDKGGTGSTSLDGGSNNLIGKLFNIPDAQPDYLASFIVNSGGLRGRLTTLGDLKAALGIPSGGGSSGWEDLGYTNSSYAIWTGQQMVEAAISVRVDRSTRTVEFDISGSIALKDTSSQVFTAIGYIQGFGSINLEPIPVLALQVRDAHGYGGTVSAQNRLFWLKIFDGYVYLKIDNMDNITCDSQGYFYPHFSSFRKAATYTDYAD